MIQKILFSFFMFLPFLGFSQEFPEVVKVGATDHKYLKEQKDDHFFGCISMIKMIYTPSEMFINTDYNRFCLPTTKLFICFRASICCFGCSYPFLTSKDSEMMIFSSFYFDDSIEKQEEQIKLRLKGNLEYLGKDVDNWERFVFFYPKKKEKRFDNNLIFKCTIPFFPEDFINRNGKEYKYAEKFFIWDKKVGFIDFTCFYTDKAKKNFKKYWKEIENLLKYEDNQK